ncbi:MAG: SUMF1/EgtB/PvdO family nonheme iron enzyme [Aureispira sp.]|nr:SUMF1/EgtB/PvdO family nonheme iron enzyme [Aureispira sp.]
MKNLTILISFLLLTNQVIAQKTKIRGIDYNKESEPAKTSKIKIPKELKPWLEDMVLIPGGTFAMGLISESDIHATDRDSNLLITQSIRQVTVSSFYLSQKEVTNYDWRLFYEAKLKELGAEKAAQYLPDTLLWQTEFPYSFNEPMTKNYYWHPAFDDFPVVGVSWLQAQAFCQWQSDYINTILEEHGIEPLSNFRLPSEAEWEFAATGGLMMNTDEPIQRVFDKAGKYNALNMGAVYDANGLKIKDYIDDGGMYTTHVGYYSPNDYGLYDMSGNVNEWVQDVARVPAGIKLGEDTPRDSIFNRLVARDKRKGSNVKMDKEVKDYYDKLTSTILRDLAVIKLSTTPKPKEDQLRVVKGGSWADPMIYQHPASRQVLAAGKASSRTGFRVAMTRMGTSDPRLGLGNGWRERQAALLPKGHNYNRKKNTSKAKW